MSETTPAAPSIVFGTDGWRARIGEDYTYDNVGTPKNPDNPFYREQPDFVDAGLGGFLATRPDYAGFAAANLGKHKVPTLRNVGLGSCEAQQRLIDNVPGAAGQPHDRLPEASHFLQDDQGTEIATRLVDWYASLDTAGDETAAGDERVGFELLERMDGTRSLDQLSEESRALGQGGDPVAALLASGNIDGDPFPDIVAASNPR